jgi:translocation and assembly module TamA
VLLSDLPLRAALAWLIAVALPAVLPAPCAAAQEAAPAAIAGDSSSESAHSATAIAYKVVVVAPSPLKETIESVVGLVRWQDYPEMTEELLDRLKREAIDTTRNLAAAEGFFAAVTDVGIDRTTTPATVTLKVTEGPPTRITAVHITVTGPAATDGSFGAQAIAKLTREWGLPEGAVFRQPAWSAAKSGALATLAASPYAAATIASSAAEIDPESRSAVLAIELESGPEFRFGNLEIAGLSRYAPELVRNFSTIKVGEPYSQRALERYLRRLNASGYFASAQAAIDTDSPHPEEATVNVAVIEGPTRRFEGGLGYSTDVAFRANASYRDVNIDGKGMQMLAEARLETKIQTGSVRFTLPPIARGWIGSFGAGAARTDIESLVTRTAFAGTRWHTLDEENENAVSLTFYLDEQQPAGAANESSHALYPEYERYWRRVDNLIAPTKGWMAVVHAGGGIPGASTRGFGRLLGRVSAWLPIDDKHELQLRGEAGAVLAPTRDGIPSTLLFRTGGDTTVRGYAFESLGVQDGDAVVPGRYLAVASVDAIRWIGEAWGVAAFVDAGNATDSLTDFHLALGYGVGARVRTPLGPFRLDLAYGQDVHKVRVHFSVGLSF